MRSCFAVALLGLSSTALAQFDFASDETLEKRFAVTARMARRVDVCAISVRRQPRGSASGLAS